MQNWHAKSPDNFRFAVKAPRLITHYKKFTHTAELLANFYSVITKGLQYKLGFVLFQLPPSMTYTEERLEKTINSLDKTVLNVVELRHASWWRQDVYDKLAEYNISFCGMSHPTLPDSVIENTPRLYYRMHGVNELYGSNYSNQELDSLATNIKSHRGLKEIYVYFNNDMYAHAIANARYLHKISPK